MSITKFLSIIETNLLFFPSLDLLSKEDKFEGLFNLVDHPLPVLAHQVSNDFQRNYRKHCFVNCWNYGVDESYALWKIYLDNAGDGVAIETTFSRLKECFKAFPEDIYIGKVNYSSGFYCGTRFSTCTTKRSPFEYEQEIRVIYEKVPLNKKGRESVQLPAEKKGHQIPLDLQVLFGRVITSPFASPWFHDLVRAVMNKYGYTHVEVSKSNLSTEPI
ncbi:MAG: hypothetical protein AAF378_23795 [Cyanobacteria bacterium P01_A01_bin.84]